MYRIWYWAMIDRETSGRFVASIPDLGDWRLMATRTRMPWLMCPNWRARVCRSLQLKWSAAPRGLRCPM